MSEDQQQELANARALAQKLIQLNGTAGEAAKKSEYTARSRAFTAGMFALLVPVLLWLTLDSKVFDGNFDEYTEEHKWASFLMIGVFTACWKGMHYLAVQRHDPERKKK